MIWPTGIMAKKTHDRARMDRLTWRGQRRGPSGRAGAGIPIWRFALATTLIALLLVFLWLRSPQGQALMATRDNESAAAGLGGID
jgi:ABC-type branched-subunit amino acid transport system permease subunit